MEKKTCIQCGAPDQDPGQECTYCGHRPAPVRQSAPEQNPAADNIVQLQGEISRFKVFIGSVGVYFLIQVIGQMIGGAS